MVLLRRAGAEEECLKQKLISLKLKHFVRANRGETVWPCAKGSRVLQEEDEEDDNGAAASQSSTVCSNTLRQPKLRYVSSLARTVRSSLPAAGVPGKLFCKI